MGFRYGNAPQPAGLKTRSVEAGNLASLLAGRRGRVTSSPPQLGHRPPSTPLAHDSQNVHSNEQIRAFVESGARSRLQHSQFGLSWSIVSSCLHSVGRKEVSVELHCAKTDISRARKTSPPILPVFVAEHRRKDNLSFKLYPRQKGRFHDVLT